MARYSSLAELKAAMMRELNKAMKASAEEMKNKMKEEIQTFYAGGSPAMYVRTGKLGNTPMTTPISSSDTTVSFKAYLNKAGGYPSITYTYFDGSTTTSKAPSMTDVLNLTNYGTTSSSVGKLHPALGGPGYWERATGQFQEILDKNIRSSFH